MFNTERHLVTIVISPDIEDVVTDWLLTREEVTSFNSYQVKSYRKTHHDYSPTELVTGWKKKIAIRVLFPVDMIPDVIDDLKKEFAHSGIYYRITPFIDEGVI